MKSLSNYQKFCLYNSNCYKDIGRHFFLKSSKIFGSVFTMVFMLIGMALMGQNNVTFKVDMSGVKDAQKVGLRGSIAPLRWDSSMLMKGPSPDGFYTLTVNFVNALPGSKLSYKYVYGDLNWDNSLLGQYGNRTCLLLGKDLTLPPDTWNKLDKLDREELLYNASSNNDFWVIFAIYNAKRNNKSIDDLAKDLVDFRKGPGFADWHPTPQEVLAYHQIIQNMYPTGKLEVIINQPSEVKFKIAKVWHFDGVYQDVTANDLSRFYLISTKLLIEEKGLVMNWEEDSKQVTLSIKKADLSTN